MNKKRINNTIKLIILFFLSISLFLSCEKNDIFDTAVTKPVVVASDHPVFSHDSGIYPPGTIVTITCTTPGATIRYTDDGTDPKTSGTAVEGPSPLVYNVSGVNNHTVIKAFTYTAGMWDSDRFSAIIVKSYTMEKAAAPVLTLAAGVFTVPPDSPTNTITSLTVTAGFRYTTDGSDPNTSPTAIPPVGDPGIPQPFTIDLTTMPTNFQKTVNLRIIAVAPGYNNSDIVSRNYEIKVANPTTNAPATGTYDNDRTGITMGAVTTGSSVYYTLDSTIPALDAVGNPIGTTTLYTVPITINKDNTQLRIRAFKTGCTPSETLEFDYTLKVGSIIVSNAGGTYPNDTIINSILTGTFGATIRYTEGTVASPPVDPTSTTGSIWTEGVSSISITETNKVVKIKAFKTNYADSDTSTQIYTLKVGDLIVSNAGGTYPNDTIINSILTGTFGATIRYTEGTVASPPVDPTSTTGSIWTEGVSSISITETNKVVKIKAFKTNYVDSNLSTQTYILKVATPTIDHATGIYNNDFTTIASTTTTSASLYYSTDGSAPVTAFGGSLFINSSSQFRVVGKKAGYVDSDISPADYTMVALDPTFAPAVGFYPGPGPLNVTLATGTTTATIYYTTDGSDPTTLSNLYPIAGIDILSTTTLRFAAFKSGYTTSNIIQMTITEAAGDFTVTSP